jgi:hypothetical protein
MIHGEFDGQKIGEHFARQEKGLFLKNNMESAQHEGVIMQTQ